VTPLPTELAAAAIRLSSRAALADHVRVATRTNVGSAWGDSGRGAG
jgi:hypothetical protein